MKNFVYFGLLCGYVFIFFFIDPQRRSQELGRGGERKIRKVCSNRAQCGFSNLTIFCSWNSKKVRNPGTVPKRIANSDRNNFKLLIFFRPLILRYHLILEPGENSELRQIFFYKIVYFPRSFEERNPEAQWIEFSI